MEKLQYALQRARAARSARIQAEAAQEAQAPEMTAATPAHATPAAHTHTQTPAAGQAGQTAGGMAPGMATAAAPAAAAQVDLTTAPRPTPQSEVWAEVPLFEPGAAQLLRKRIVTLEPSVTANSFDILRTKILLQMQKNGWSRLAITSPTGACGKSTVACNLAVGLTRQTDIRAILLELDLRRPMISSILGFTPSDDISSILTGTIPLHKQAIRLRDNVLVAAARRRMNDPTSILLARQTSENINLIEESYAPDLLIFDLPPILLGDDTRAFLSNVDCALIVARAEETTVGQIDACEAEIGEQTNVLGVVLNQCRYIDSDTGYGSYYGSD